MWCMRRCVYKIITETEELKTVFNIFLYSASYKSFDI